MKERDMEERITKADGNGKIDVNGQVSPVAYNLSVKEGKGPSYEINIRLSVPRDWLLKRGFDKDAMLISQSGARIPVYYRDSSLTVADDISVELTARDDSCTSKTDVIRKYPELDRSVSILDGVKG
jgi:hypothetical protein